MLANMQLWFPQQIVEPFGLEFQLSRRLEKDVLLSSSFLVDVDSIDARVSLNDVVLFMSIINQRALTLHTTEERKKTEDKKAALDWEKSTAVHCIDDFAASESKSMAATVAQHLTAYSVSVNIGVIKIVTINDFNGQNLPVLR